MIFAILIAADISLVTWLAQNHGEADPLLVIAGVIGGFLVTFVIVWINSVAYQKINDLKEL